GRGKSHSATPGVEHGVEHRCHLVGLEMADHLIEAGQHRRRIARVESVRAQCVSDAPHHGGRSEAMADDVTDGGADMTVRELEDVVPVTADEAMKSREVAGGDVQA